MVKINGMIIEFNASEDEDEASKDGARDRQKDVREGLPESKINWKSGM